MSLYSEGRLDAPLILVGEAPGEQELRTGLPFQGPAGDLLNECLHAAGITRHECYITNVLKFRPENNNADVYYNSKKGTMTDEFSAAQVNLTAELASTTGATIMALGDAAMFALLGFTDILKRRGSVYTREFGGRERSIIPILHPAAALRTYTWRNLITWDLLRAKEIMTNGWVAPARTIYLRPGFREMMHYIDQCYRSKLVGFDIEIVNEELFCFALAIDQNNIMCFPLKDEHNDYLNPHQEVELIQALGALLATHPIIGQNLNFDYTFMLRRYGLYIKNLEDTMVAQGILYPDLPKGLDFITSIYTKEPYYKDEGKKSKKVSNLENFWIYNAKDAAVCLEAWPELKLQLEQLGNWDTYRRQRDTIQQLAYMQHRGLRMDVAGMKAAATDASMRIADLQIQLEETTDIKGFNANSPKQVQTYFYITKKLPAYKNKTGGLTSDEDALIRIARKGYPEAQMILDIRELAKARGTYYTMHLDDDERLRCSMNPVGTKQGRFSSSKTIFGTGGNMQNQPEQMLGFMTADPGCFLISMDLEQAENRIVAVLANDENMLEAFAAGLDIHSLTASYLLNKPVSEIKKEKHTAPIGPSHWSERDLGKRTNHGLNYDMSYVKFALKNEMLEKDAKILINKYHAIYPRVRAVFHKDVKNSIYSTRRIKNCFGRVRLFLDRISEEVFREGYSFNPQSTVADIINEWGLNWIEKHSVPTGYMEHIEFLNNVHDSIVLQAPLDRHAVETSCNLSRLIQSLEQQLSWKNLTFCIPVGVKIGFNLLKTKELKLDGKLGSHWISAETLSSALEELQNGTEAGRLAQQLC